jgi:hypothetical protein
MDFPRRESRPTNHAEGVQALSHQDLTGEAFVASKATRPQGCERGIANLRVNPRYVLFYLGDIVNTAHRSPVSWDRYIAEELTERPPSPERTGGGRRWRAGLDCVARDDARDPAVRAVAARASREGFRLLRVPASTVTLSQKKRWKISGWLVSA